MAEFQAGPYIVGLLAILSDRASPFGSGALVKWGKLTGILTADHVAQEMLSHDEIGLMHFGTRSQQFQGAKIQVKDLTITRLGNGAYDHRGPDIAFIRLFPGMTGSLEANGSFFDIGRQMTLSRQPSPKGTEAIDFAIGVIEKWTKQPVVEGQKSTTPIAALQNFGSMRKIRKGRLGLDRFMLTPTPSVGFNPPPTYGAVSGGPWMRMFRRPVSFEFVELRLMGVAFFETNKNVIADNRILCHGPKAVYRKLLPLVRKLQ